MLVPEARSGGLDVVAGLVDGGPQGRVVQLLATHSDDLGVDVGHGVTNLTYREAPFPLGPGRLRAYTP